VKSLLRNHHNGCIQDSLILLRRTPRLRRW